MNMDQNKEDDEWTYRGRHRCKYKKIDEEFHKNMEEILRLEDSKLDLIHHYPVYVGHVNIARHLFFYEMYKKCYELQGHIADIGTWKGASFLFMAKLVRLFENYNATQVHGFDWFKGMIPSKEDKDFDYSKEGAEYACEYEKLKKLIELQKLDDIALIHKMDLTKELGSFFEKRPHLRFKIVFLDCGIKKVLEESLKHFWPRLVNGGILILDHYNLENSPWENEIAEKYIGKNLVRQWSQTRQPSGYIIKEK